jgi:hypothetical protein
LASRHFTAILPPIMTSADDNSCAREQSEQAPGPQAPPSSRHRPPWLLIATTLCFVTTLAAGLIVYLKTIDKVDAAVGHLVNAFAKEEITETFLLSQIQSASTNGALLEVATADAVELFTRTSALKYWDRELPLGTTVSEITVPATYRFHINLNDPWNLSVDESTCIVQAPAFQPSLPVAIDTAGMQKKTRSGWARFDKDENLEKLERGLTEQLSQRASSNGSRMAVREDSRHSVALFVRNWLLREQQWGSGRFTKIVVYFPDESPPADPAKFPEPSITFEPAPGT